jgi:nitrous oxidase accessory protein NosD
MSTPPRQILTDLVARYGEGMMGSPLRCEGLLKDYCGEFRREIYVLTSCLRVGLVEQMRRQSGPSIKLICARLALKLEQNLAISGDVAKWAVESWAVALGLMRPEQATIPLNRSRETTLRPETNGEEGAARAPIDFRTETLPLPDSAATAQEEPVEFLAQEPDAIWTAPDWSAPSATIAVWPDGSAEGPALRDAVRDAAENACLALQPGHYSESLVIKKNLRIRAEGDGAVTLEALGTASVFVLEGACLRLERLVIRGLGGKDKKAQPAVEIKSGRLEMEDCDLTSDSSTVLEVRGEQAEAVVRRCHLHDGKAGGVLFADGGAGFLEACHLYQNKLSQVVIGKDCSPVLSGCKISHALMAGIYISEGGEGLIEDCDIWGNAVGGVQCRRGGNPRLRYCRISANERYGVLVTEQGEGLYEHCQIFENAAVGVTISHGSAPRFSSCRIFDNHGPGVAFSDGAQGELLDCEIFTNDAANVSVTDKSKPALYRCVVHDGSEEGVVVSGQSEGHFEACEISMNAAAGILLTEASRPVFQQCVLHHGRATGLTATQGAEGQFTDCEFTHHAGTALLVGEKAQPHFERCHVRENQAVGVQADAAAPVLQACVIEKNGGTGFTCTQNATPRMTEGEIAENGGGLAVASQGKGRWERVQFFDNHGDTVLVADGGRPALHLCHIEGAQGAGLRFQAQGQGMIEDVDILGSGGPGIEIEAGASPSIKQVKVLLGKGPGIVVRAEGAGTLEACEAAENAGGDWQIDEAARVVRV